MKTHPLPPVPDLPPTSPVHPWDRRFAPYLPILAAFAALLAGCGAPPGDTDPTTPPAATPALTYYRDVAPILQARCLSCHYAGSIAPYPLETYDQVRALAASIQTAVLQRTMPPWGVDSSGVCNTFKDARWLSDAEIDTLRAWTDGPLDEGDPADAPPPLEPAPGLSEVSATLDMGLEYTPPDDVDDDYRCFILDPGQADDAYITGYAVRPGDPTVVHHVLLYSLLSEDGEAQVEALDAADDGPGYTCFGGPGASYVSVLAAWAPGTPVTRFPEDTGLLLPGGRKVVLQVHYNTASGTGPDRTAIDLELRPDVEAPGIIALVGDMDLVLPPGLPDAATLVDTWPGQMGAPGSVTVYGVFPHMHRLGRTLEADYLGADGRGACMARVPDWDFNWQQIYFFEKPLAVGADDLIRITCGYDTTGRDQPVPYGEGTSDEMCIAGFFVTTGQGDGAVSPLETGEEAGSLGGVDDIGGALEHTWSLSVAGQDSDVVRRLAVDAAGDTLVAGFTESAALDFDGGRMATAAPNDGFVAKYDRDGGYVWSLLIDGSGDDGLNSVAPAPDGGIFVCGWTQSTGLVLGDDTFSSVGGYDILVLKLDADGQPNWGRTFGSEASDTCWDVVPTADGGLVFASSQDGSIDFGDGAIEPGGMTGSVIVSLSADGAYRWALPVRSSSYAQTLSLASGPDGRIALGGEFSGDLGLGDLSVGAAGGVDGFVAGIDPEGTPRWLTRIGDVRDDQIRTVHVAPDGDVLAGGRFTGTVTLGNDRLAFHGTNDGLFARFSPDGAARWARAFAGISGESVTGIATSARGNLVVTGHYEASTDAGGGGMANRGSGDVLIGFYSAEGSFLAAHRLGGTASDWQAYLGVVGEEAVVVAWSSHGDVDAGGETFSGKGGADLVLAQFATGL